MDIKKLNEQLSKYAKTSMKEFYEVPLDESINMELVYFGKHDGLDRYELDGVEFFVAEDEDLQNAIETCIDEEFMPEWKENSDAVDFSIDSVDFIEGKDEKGFVGITVFGENLEESLNENKSYFVSLDGERVSDYYDNKAAAIAWAEENYSIDDDRIAIEDCDEELTESKNESYVIMYDDGEMDLDNELSLEQLVDMARCETSNADIYGEKEAINALSKKGYKVFMMEGLNEDLAYEESLMDAFETVRGAIETAMHHIKLESKPVNFNRIANAMTQLKLAADAYELANDPEYNGRPRNEVLKSCYNFVQEAKKHLG